MLLKFSKSQRSPSDRDSQAITMRGHRLAALTMNSCRSSSKSRIKSLLMSSATHLACHWDSRPWTQTRRQVSYCTDWRIWINRTESWRRSEPKNPIKYSLNWWKIHQTTASAILRGSVWRSNQRIWSKVSTMWECSMRPWADRSTLWWETWGVWIMATTVRFKWGNPSLLRGKSWSRD